MRGKRDRILRSFGLSTKKTNVIGVFNVTTGSFSDGGLFLDPKAAVKRGKKLVKEGADIFRVHDVEECMKALKLIDPLKTR